MVTERLNCSKTKPYEFGDSIANIDIPQTLINAMLRDGTQLPIRMKSDDIEVHRTRNNPKSATVVIMDMSGSMRYDGQYVNVKRMALALDGLIRREYPGDFLRFIEMYTFAKLRQSNEIVDLMPKPVTIHDPIVQLRADMSRDDISESMVPPAFHEHSARTSTGSAVIGNARYSESPNCVDYGWLTDGSFRRQLVVHALSSGSSNGRSNDA